MNDHGRAKRFALPRWWPLAAVVLATAALLMWRVTRDLMLAFLGIPVSKPNPPCSGIYINSVQQPRLTASQYPSGNASRQQSGAIDGLCLLDGVRGQITDPAEVRQ